MEQRLKQYYLDCGIKSSWHEKDLKSFDNDEVSLAKVKKYLKDSKSFYNDGVGLYLWGANGSGKSHLMNCAFKELIDARYKVRVFSMDEIVDKFTSSWYADSEKKELDNILRNIDFLGIDEFGKNLDKDGKPMYLPDLVKRVMESVIRFRVQMKKPIWFASNTEPANVKEVFSEDIASLLKEAVIHVLVTGGDYRGNISKINKRRLL